jgi:hypothetical protein
LSHLLQDHFELSQKSESLMEAGPSAVLVASAVSLEELDALYVAVLPRKELRKLLSTSFSDRAWALLADMAQAPMSDILMDADALAAHRARLLDTLKVRAFVS